MIDLNGVSVHEHFNGIGYHDTPGCYAGCMNYQEARAHGRELREHGVTLYKLLVSGGNKVERARGYRDEGITVIVRNYVHQPWGKDPGSWVMPTDQIKLYADVGVQLFEIAGNEVNISCEWENDDIPRQAYILADAAIAAWRLALVACESAGEGIIPLFTSMTPGGHVDHRWVYKEIAAKLKGKMPTHVAIHNRPHNNPPDTPWTATNTVTFDEWRWIRDTLGGECYLWATESGHSLKDDQNRNYPQIDLRRHTDYNWEWFVRMNPKHPKATEPGLAGICHWFEQSWGHYHVWGKDSLRDSNVPEMPAPSPLFDKMTREAEALNFSRYGGIVVKPPTYRTVDLVGKLPVHPLCNDPDPKKRVRYDHRALGNISLSVLHYTWVTPPLSDEAHEIAQIQSIARGHIRANWPGIGYHVMVGGSGTKYRVNALETVSYHAAPNNSRSIGIACMLREGAPTAAQVASTAALLTELGYPVKLHKELNDTLCPGTKLGPMVRAAMTKPIDPPVDPPASGFHVEYRPGEGRGLPLVIGNYPRAGVVLGLIAPWGLEVAAEAGTKLEYGPGGFELMAPDDHSEFTLTAEGKSWKVQMVAGKSSWCVWQQG